MIRNSIIVFILVLLTSVLYAVNYDKASLAIGVDVPLPFVGSLGMFYNTQFNYAIDTTHVPYTELGGYLRFCWNPAMLKFYWAMLMNPLYQGESADPYPYDTSGYKFDAEAFISLSIQPQFKMLLGTKYRFLQPELIYNKEDIYEEYKESSWGVWLLSYNELGSNNLLCISLVGGPGYFNDQFSFLFEGSVSNIPLFQSEKSHLLLDASLSLLFSDNIFDLLYMMKLGYIFSI